MGLSMNDCFFTICELSAADVDRKHNLNYGKLIAIEGFTG